MAGQTRLIEEPGTQQAAQDLPGQETFLEQAHKSTADQKTNIKAVQDLWSCSLTFPRPAWQAPDQLMGLARQRMSLIISVPVVSQAQPLQPSPEVNRALFAPN